VPFTFEPTGLPGLVIVRPRVFADDRGFFTEGYKDSDFQRAGLPGRFVQDNQSLSTRGVLRGLHYQLPPYAQGKLVQVLNGRV
jgi:dTDP-4-dehydrorhamnose 3,5-epimerase